MGISVTFEADKKTVEHLAEEHETNESSFIRFFCEELLNSIANETRKVGDMANNINKVNPFGFPLAF